MPKASLCGGWGEGGGGGWVGGGGRVGGGNLVFERLSHAQGHRVAPDISYNIFYWEWRSEGDELDI